MDMKPTAEDLAYGRQMAVEFEVDPDTKLGECFVSMVAVNRATEGMIDVTTLSTVEAQFYLDAHRQRLAEAEAIYADCPIPSMEYLCRCIRKEVARIVNVFGETPNAETHNLTRNPVILERLRKYYGV